MGPTKPLRFLDVPALERRPWGILCLVLNIVPWGGIGTIIAGVRAKHTGSIIVGILQALLTIAIVGYLWSIVWGIAIFLRSR